jgi:hypothetical protein
VVRNTGSHVFAAVLHCVHDRRYNRHVVFTCLDAGFYTGEEQWPLWLYLCSFYAGIVIHCVFGLRLWPLFCAHPVDIGGFGFNWDLRVLYSDLHARVIAYVRMPFWVGGIFSTSSAAMLVGLVYIVRFVSRLQSHLLPSPRCCLLFAPGDDYHLFCRDIVRLVMAVDINAGISFRAPVAPRLTLGVCGQKMRGNFVTLRYGYIHRVLR